MAEVIVVTSGKGGVGKTTTAANIGAGLALSGRKTVIVDMDIGLRNLDIVIGLENRIVYHIIDVLEKSCRLKQALIRDKRIDGLYILPAAQTRDKGDIQPEQMIWLCEQLKSEFDYVILDCPAGIEQGFKNSIIGADRAIVVTTPEVSSVRDADRVIGILESNSLKNNYLVINRVCPELIKQGDMLNTEDIVGILAIELLGIVPDDSEVVVSTNKGEPLVYSGTNLVSKAYKNMARRILGETVPFLDLNTESWVHRFLRFFKLSA